MLNKQKGNMYGFVTHTWNVIKGICPHECKYCYMKVYKQSPLHFDEKELKTDLGENNFIFVGSSCDMFADKIKAKWIIEVLKHCCKYPRNKYLFQTKNPDRFKNFKSQFPENTILGTTLETNYLNNYLSKAPLTTVRASAMTRLPKKFKRMITLEPLVEFNLKSFVNMIKEIRPSWINIGVDSKGHNLREPSKEDVEALIKELKKFTKVKLKSNLRRLIR